MQDKGIVKGIFRGNNDICLITSKRVQFVYVISNLSF